MKTTDEIRRSEVQRQQEKAIEEKRLKEKVLCAEITFPPQMQRQLGITGFIMKASEVEELVENEIENRSGNTVTFKIRYSMRTNKWIENLPEADI